MVFEAGWGIKFGDEVGWRLIVFGESWGIKFGTSPDWILNGLTIFVVGCDGKFKVTSCRWWLNWFWYLKSKVLSTHLISF